MRLSHRHSHAVQVRSGLTLLEVLLASALAVVLMAALYVALEVQLRLANTGREAVEQATLVRAIVQRLNNDLTGGLCPTTPPADTSGAATTTTETDAAASATSAVTTSDTIAFGSGVIGESDRLTLFVSRVAGAGRNIDESGETPLPSDIRRVMYWLTDHGMARQEIPWVTSERLQTSTDPDFEDGKSEKDFVIADEVTKLQFEYWDGSAWASSWDGKALAADGKTPRGPPAAIRVRFTLRLPGDHPGQTVEKEFRHTVALLTAGGPATADTAQTGQ